MNIIGVIVVATAAVLTVYLFYALIHPEKF